MMKRTRTAAIAALGLGVALSASACAGGSSSGSGNGSSSSGHVTLTFWTNATPGPGLTYFRNAIKTFDTLHPNVTINMQNIQNEDYDGKLQTALNSGTAPDIFFQRGGGKMLAMVNANQVQALTQTPLSGSAVALFHQLGVTRPPALELVDALEPAEVPLLLLHAALVTAAAATATATMTGFGKPRMRLIS